MNEKPAYTLQELQVFHPAGRSSIYKDLADGRLKAKKIGDRTIVLHTDYIEYLQALPDYQPKAGEDPPPNE